MSSSEVTVRCIAETSLSSQLHNLPEQKFVERAKMGIADRDSRNKNANIGHSLTATLVRLPAESRAPSAPHPQADFRDRRTAHRS